MQIHFVILRNTCFQFTSFRMLSVAHSGSSGSWSPCNFDQEPLQSVSNYTYFNLHKSVLQFREILVLNLKKYTVVAKIPLAPSGCCQWHTLAVQGLGHRVIYFNSLSTSEAAGKFTNLVFPKPARHAILLMCRSL